MLELHLNLDRYGESKINFDLRGYAQDSKRREIHSIIRINNSIIPIRSKMHDFQGMCRNYVIHSNRKEMHIEKESDFYFYGSVEELIMNYHHRRHRFTEDGLLRFKDKAILAHPKSVIKSVIYSFYYKIPMQKMQLDHNKGHLIPIIFDKIRESIKKEYNKLERVSLNGCPDNWLSCKLSNLPTDFIEKIKARDHFYYIKRRYPPRQRYR